MSLQHPFNGLLSRTTRASRYQKGGTIPDFNEARDNAPISLDGVAVHPECWCICLCYLHFVQENPEDGEMYLPVLTHPGCPGQSPESHKMVAVVLVDDGWQWHQLDHNADHLHLASDR